MISEGYSVPSATIRIETIVLKSRFITTAGFADTVDAAKTFIQRVRHEMPDADHHVYAFRVGHGTSTVEGMSDDGEPSGTSGPPTLAVVRGSDIGDIVVVTTRYFGGAKLGTGGLSRAYGTAAREVIAALPLTKKLRWSSYAVDLPYSLYELTIRLLEAYSAVITDQTFGTNVSVHFCVPASLGAALIESMTQLSSGKVLPILLD